MNYTKTSESKYKFKMNKEDHIIEFLETGEVEIYQEDRPHDTGFIFPDVKEFNFFCSCITDAIIDFSTES